MVGEIRTPAVTNPLWIIGLLLGICELTLGAAATLTSGWIQGLFAVFMVAYTTAVTGGFFYILSNRAHVFYSPREYRGGATVDEYTRAVARARVVTSTMNAVIASVERSLKGEDVSEASAESIVHSVRAELDNAAVYIDLSPLDSGLGSIVFPATEESTVSNLLDTVYYALPETFPPFSYGRYWLLRRLSDGVEFDRMGTQWVISKGDDDRDYRPLSEVGITGGDRLAVIPGPRLRAIRRHRSAHIAE